MALTISFTEAIDLAGYLIREAADTGDTFGPEDIEDELSGILGGKFSSTYGVVVRRALQDSVLHGGIVQVGDSISGEYIGYYHNEAERIVRNWIKAVGGDLIDFGLNQMAEDDDGYVCRLTRQAALENLQRMVAMADAEPYKDHNERAFLEGANNFALLIKE